MIKYVCLFTIVLMSTMGNAQAKNLSFYGEILGIEADIDTLFYSFNEEAFTPKQYILLNGKNYTFNITTKTIKNLNISMLNFAIDRTVTPTTSSDHYVRINIDKLLTLSPSNTIIWRINSNIELYKHDDTINYRNTKGSDLDPFIGHYTMTSKTNKDTVYNITLSGELQRYTSTFNLININLMNGEWGNWKYDKLTQTLSFSVYKETNTDIGLEKMVVRRFYTFKVIEIDGQLNFESDLFELVKIE